MWNIVRAAEGLTLIPVEQDLPPGAEVLGQTIDPDALAPQEPVPSEITRFQARTVLAQTVRNGVNLFEAVDDFMLTLSRTDVRRRAWEDAQVFERASPTVAAIAMLFALTDAEVDDLFRVGSKIKA